VNELNHRVKNMLTTVQSITHQTLKHASSLTAGQANIEARLAALARTHDLLTEQGYDSAPIGGIVHRSLSPFAIDRWRLFTQGPDTLMLRPRQALDLALVLHELATNAIKYGAWSNREGSVTATWTMDGNGSKQFLHFRWIETGGPPVEPTMRTGFGSRLIKTLTNGEAQIGLERSGLSCSVTFVLSQGDADQHR
jgi:two-component sensor histidine kinase